MGALGRVHGNGDLELALTIRTFAIADGTVHLWVGGGVVWDSDPAAEVAESLTKAGPLLAAIGAPLHAAARPAALVSPPTGADPGRPATGCESRDRSTLGRHGLATEVGA